MVIDDSTAKAVIKKQIKVFKRRLEFLSDKMRSAGKSRTKWLRRVHTMISNATWPLMLVEHDKYHADIICLIPDEYDRGLQTCCYRLNLKQCHVDIQGQDMVFTTHFLIRLMQARKTTNLVKDLTNDIAGLIDYFIFSSTEFPRHCGVTEYGLYMEGLGFVPFIFERSPGHIKIVVKTLIPPSCMGPRHLSIYQEIKESGGVAMYKNPQNLTTR